MNPRRDLRTVRPALLVGLWVLLTYGFRLVTAIRMRTWDSVIASVVLLGLSVAVAVLAARRRSGRATPGLVPLIRVLAVLAMGWSAFRLTTVWTGDWSGAFRAVHTVIAGVLLVLALWSLLAVHAPDRAPAHSRGATVPMPGAVLAVGDAAAADGSGQTVPSGGVDPVRR